MVLNYLLIFGLSASIATVQIGFASSVRSHFSNGPVLELPALSDQSTPLLFNSSLKRVNDGGNITCQKRLLITIEPTLGVKDIRELVEQQDLLALFAEHSMLIASLFKETNEARLNMHFLYPNPEERAVYLLNKLHDADIPISQLLRTLSAAIPESRLTVKNLKIKWGIDEEKRIDEEVNKSQEEIDHFVE